jgi:hypothetical protein
VRAWPATTPQHPAKQHGDAVRGWEHLPYLPPLMTSAPAMLEFLSVESYPSHAVVAVSGVASSNKW